MKKLIFILLAAFIFLNSCKLIKKNTLYVEGLNITANIKGKSVYDAAVIRHTDGTDRIVFVYSNQDDEEFFCTDGLLRKEQDEIFNENYSYTYPAWNKFSSIPKLCISEERIHFAVLGDYGLYCDEPCMVMYVDRLQSCQGRYITDFNFYDNGWFCQYEDYDKNIMIMQYQGDGLYGMPKIASFASGLKYINNDIEYQLSGINDYKEMPKIIGNDFHDGKVQIGRKKYNGFKSNGYVFYWK